VGPPPSPQHPLEAGAGERMRDLPHFFDTTGIDQFVLDYANRGIAPHPDPTAG
jgi:hypothetical protein